MKYFIAPKTISAFSLVEASFVISILAILILPIMIQQVKLNESNQSQNLGSQALTESQALVSLADETKRNNYIEDIASKLAALSAKGIVVSQNLGGEAEIYNPANALNLDTSFLDSTTGEYELHLETDATMTFGEKTFYMQTSDTGNFIPVFNYAWKLRDRSFNDLANLNANTSTNTSRGSFLVNAELVIYPVDYTQVQNNSSSTVTASASMPLLSLNSLFNFRANALIQKAKEVSLQANQVLLTFTFDFSGGACHFPASSYYNERQGRRERWGMINLISSVDTDPSRPGRYCSPFLMPNNTNNNGASGTITGSTTTLNSSDYDIYYNDGSYQLFYGDTTNSKVSKLSNLPLGSLATGSLFSGSALLSSTNLPNTSLTYSLLRPKLDAGGLFLPLTYTPPTVDPESSTSYQFTSPDVGDVDWLSLKEVRCNNQNYNGWDSSSSDAYGGPTAGSSLTNYTKETGYTSLDAGYTSLDYLNFQAPFNTNISPSCTSPDESYYRFLQRGFESNTGTPTILSTTNKTWWVLEGARMPFIADYSLASLPPIGPNSLGYLAHPNDTIPEPQRWISGMEWQRSLALITMFELLKKSTVNTTNTLYRGLSVDLISNQSSGNSQSSVDDNNTTGTILFNGADWTKAEFNAITSTNFKTLMKKLYSINRRMPTASDRTLAKGKQYHLKDSLETYAEGLRDAAQLKCADAGNTSSHCNNKKNWEQYTYSKMVNVVFIPGEMSAEVKHVWHNSSYINQFIYNSTSTNDAFDQDTIVNAIDDIGNKAFRKKQVYLFVIHGKAFFNQSFQQ